MPGKLTDIWNYKWNKVSSLQEKNEVHKVHNEVHKVHITLHYYMQDLFFYNYCIGIVDFFQSFS